MNPGQASPEAGAGCPRSAKLVKAASVKNRPVDVRATTSRSASGPVVTSQGEER